jgi:hypothetical protein
MLPTPPVLGFTVAVAPASPPEPAVDGPPVELNVPEDDEVVRGWW